MLTRAYSVLDIKSLDEDQRVIEGIASTPTTDRMGDIVEPSGASFALPIPLLWQHRADQPIGQVTSASVTPEGIRIRAEIAKDVLPRIDEAWKLIKSGLVRGLSIGFRATKEPEPIKGTWGMKFSAWEWLELSAVTIPANAEASIQMIKSVDATDRAASGEGRGAKHVGTPGVTGAVVWATKGASTTMKSISEQIADLGVSRETKKNRMGEIMHKSEGDGTTLDPQQQEEFDGLKAEVKAIDEHINRLQDLDAINKATAKPVGVVDTPQAASAARDTAKQPFVTVKSNLEPGMEFCRMVLCKAAAFAEIAKGNFITALDLAKQRYPDNPRIHQYLQHKTAVAGGTTTDSNFASAFLATAQTLESEFLEYLRPQTVVGKFGRNGIPALTPTPFNVKIQSQTSGATAAWVGQGKGKPVTKFNSTSTTLLFTKIAAISVITEELARFSSPNAEAFVRNELTKAVIERMDTDFLDPAKAESSGVNPASITYGLTAKTSAGVSAANALTDLQNIINPFILANYDVSKIVLIMPTSLALVLSLMENSLGQPAFAGITVNGGNLRGFPVITSQYAASGASYGNMVIAVHAPSVALADDGRVTVDASREASIEMSDAPANESATPTASAYMVSMFQTNSIALRAEREVNWKKLRSDAVVYMDDVNWGSIGSPY